MAYQLVPNSERIESKQFQDGFWIAFFLILWVLVLIALFAEFEWSTLFSAIIMPVIIAIIVRQQTIEEDLLEQGTGVYEVTSSKMTALQSGKELQFSSFDEVYFYKGNLHLVGACELILSNRIYGKEALEKVARLIRSNLGI